MPPTLASRSRCHALFAALIALPATAAPPVVEGPFTPVALDRDLRSLPRLASWRPGDPVLVRDEADEDAETGLLPEPERERLRDREAVCRPDDFVDPLVRASRAVSVATLSAPDVNVEGMSFTGISPPDTVGAVGPRHFVQMVNDPAGAAVSIFDKRGQQVAGPLAFQELWPSGDCRDFGRGDPIALFDDLADRWLLSELAVTPSCFTASQDCHLCVAISQTDDPVVGGWWLYDFALDAFPDYPKYGVWPDAYYVGTNQVERVNGQVVQTAGAYALDRARMLAGQPATLQRFSQPPLPGFFFQGLLPATVEAGLTAAAAPPAGSPGLFLRQRDSALHDQGVGDDVLELWQLHVSWSTPAASSLAGPIRIPLAPFSSAVGSISQGSGAPLIARHEPPMWHVGYRRLADGEHLTGNFTVAVTAGGRPALRWFDLRNVNGDWRVAQEGTVAPDAGDRWMGSVATDHQGNLAAIYNAANVSNPPFPSILYGGRRAGDPAGSFDQPEQQIVGGLGWQENGVWGDYASLSVDPEDGCSFWGTHQYVRANHRWGTRVASFRFTDCLALPPPPTCTPSDTTLCLQDGRFAVQATWRTPTGAHGHGHAQALTGDTGYFWFFQPANVEMLVKVLDACGLSDHFWVFAGGLTNVEVEWTVSDSASGAVRTYTNPPATAFHPVQDTSAFATCP